MIAPKYIEQNIINSICQYERFKSHRDRVQMIASDRSSSKKQFHMDSNKLQKIKTNQYNSKASIQQMRDKILYIENSKILDRIIKIKPSTRQHSASSIRSLNLPKRKKEAMKIVDENQKLMKRLQSTQGTFKNKDTQMRDFRRYPRK
ncbi:unnamed protein product [Paramecium sonneborni]|uniref:Uncharacterized protein n=1 Tax=Paramecium sonneborni TaxID=65129 RepID=A0A8S1RNW4_9CILI|nr:unnamed protein product [Paramecium sonneborni]